jgi:uncharacterized protein YdaU (DUF1376 family)
MASYPSMPLWTDAYLADTRHLSTQEHGAYLLLLMVAWRRPDCNLPDDDKLLARFAGLGPRQWKNIKDAVLEFWTLEDGCWTQKRLLKERSFVVNRSKINSANAHKRDYTKSRKTKKTKNANASVEQCETDAPTPIPTPIDKDTNVSLYKPPDKFEEFWKQYPRRVAKGEARKAYKKAIKKVDHGIIMAGLARYNPDPDFTCHPATWLNQERWQDEPDNRVKGVTAERVEPRPGRGDIIGAAQRFQNRRKVVR